MNIIANSAIYEIATLHPDPAFRCLLSRLLAAISCDGEFDPTELVRLVVIDPGDMLETVHTELGYTLTSAWEACDREGSWYALTYILSDWGEGLLVFIPDQPGIDPAFRKLCSVTQANS